MKSFQRDSPAGRFMAFIVVSSDVTSLLLR